MVVNPYQSPECQDPLSYSQVGQHRFSLAEGRLLVAILAVTTSTVAGYTCGIFGGFPIMMAIPREMRPECGLYMALSGALAGAALGFVCGCWYSWKRICREPATEAPVE